ncbi:hypothetical protein ACET81_20970 [Aeromonas veronii]
MKNADMPAFPVTDENGMPFNSLPKEPCTIGLTKLEAFTKAAMQGLLAGGYCLSDGDARHRLKDVPTEAVNIARAVLDELEKGQP